MDKNFKGLKLPLKKEQTNGEVTIVSILNKIPYACSAYKLRNFGDYFSNF